MNIYFIGSIRGGRINQPNYAEIVEILKQKGNVLSRHVAEESISEHGETELSKEEIHDREIASLVKSDLVVAEVTAPSLGVGYLISEALHIGKKVIALYQGEDNLKLSAMIKGNKNIRVLTYDTLENLKAILFSEIT